MIVGGVMSDLIVLAALGIWTIKGKTWRFPITLVMVYVAKAVTCVSKSKTFCSDRQCF